MPPIRFSQQYGITRARGDDWFDPLLSSDTGLYVDPFLIYLDKTTFWTNAHGQLMGFFNMVLTLLAESGFDPASQKFQRAEKLLIFHEPPEFCLGKTKGSIFGSGSAKGLQQGVLEGAAEAIRLHIEQDLRHFEELALFGKQFGADRISDVACNVLKPQFVEYTQALCRELGVPLTPVTLRTLGWDEPAKAWKPGVAVELPLNPIASKHVGHPVGVILTPKRFLRRAPSIDPQDFWDYAWHNENEELRSNFNAEISRNVDAATIAKLARQKRHLLVKYLEHLAEEATPYDVDDDPDLIVNRPDFGVRIAEDMATRVEAPTSEADFVSFIEQLVENFKHAVETYAWRNLWIGDRVRKEEHAQVLFQTSANPLCEMKGVDITGEADAGRGPVDFKMSQGWSRKVLIEIKYAKSTSFWRNLETQTPVYAKAEKCDRGWFLVLQTEDKHTDAAFIDRVNKIAERVAAEHKLDFRALFVDARQKASGSKVKIGEV